MYHYCVLHSMSQFKDTCCMLRIQAALKSWHATHMITSSEISWIHHTFDFELIFLIAIFLLSHIHRVECGGIEEWWTKCPIECYIIWISICYLNGLFKYLIFAVHKMPVWHCLTTSHFSLSLSFSLLTYLSPQTYAIGNTFKFYFNWNITSFQPSFNTFHVHPLSQIDGCLKCSNIMKVYIYWYWITNYESHRLSGTHSPSSQQSLIACSSSSIGGTRWDFAHPHWPLNKWFICLVLV